MTSRDKLAIIRWAGAVLLAAIALFGLFIWPTQYEYTRDAPNVWRVNRFTGVRETSTAEGWKTDQQIQADKKSKQEIADVQAAKEKGARQAAEEAHNKELLAGRDLPSFKFGPDGSYSAETKIAFLSSKALIRLVIKPFNGSLRDAVDRGAPVGNLQLLSESSFVLHEIPLGAGDFTRVVDEKGRFAELTTQKEVFMTESDFQQIKDCSLTWRF